MTRRVRVAVVLLSGLGAIVQAAQVREHDRKWVAPDRAASKLNPLSGHAELAAGGHKIFEQRCTQCHGDDAQGTSRAPNLLSGRVQAQSDGALFWKISSGDTRAGMPSFSFLPETQRWQVVLYLRGLARTAGTQVPSELVSAAIRQN
jgi:mono/diheme cytochrome c family protein